MSEASLIIAGRWYAINGNTIIELANYMDECPHKIAKVIHQIIDKKLQLIPNKEETVDPSVSPEEGAQPV